jgi:hypothetical protein
MALDYNPFEKDQAPNSLVLRKNRVKVHEEPPPLPQELTDQNPEGVTPAERAGDAQKSPPDQKAGDSCHDSHPINDLESLTEVLKSEPPPKSTTQNVEPPPPSASPAQKSGDAERSPPAERAGDMNNQIDPFPAWKLAKDELYTEFPHRFVMCLEQEELSLREFRFLIFLARETFGWHRSWVTLKNKIILERTRIPERHLRDTLKNLQRLGIVLIQERKSPNGQTLANNFAFNEQYFRKYLVPDRGILDSKQSQSPAEKAGDDLSAGPALSAGSGDDLSAGEDPCSFSGGRRIVIPNKNKDLSQENAVLKKEDLNKDLNKSLSLSETTHFFDEIYFSKIRAPKLEREEREAFNSIIKRNSDLTIQEIKECFSVVESEHDANGNVIKSKFVWMAKGLDRILIEARDNLAWRHQPGSALLPSTEEPTNTSIPQVVSLTQDQEEARAELLQEVKLSRSSLVAAEKAYLENSADNELKHKMSQARERFERLLVTNEILLAPEIKRYTDTEPKRFRDLITAIEKYAFTGRVNLASEQAAVFRIIQEQQTDWYPKIMRELREKVSSSH